jgi:cation diffusion facilitator CzcD-associated flavoprotein CzcO
MGDYFSRYAEHFGLYASIRTNHLVAHVQKTENGSYDLVAYNSADQTFTEVSVPRLIIGSGVFSNPYMPSATNYSSSQRIFSGARWVQRQKSNSDWQCL